MPPVISKVATPKSNGTVIVSGSESYDDAFDGAVSIAKLKTSTINMVLYGVNRIGKTTLACLFPKPLALLSYEPGESGGASSVKKSPATTFMRVQSKAKAVAIANRLMTDNRSNWRWNGKSWDELVDAKGNPVFAGDPFATTVHDTCTSLQEVILREMMGLDAAPVQLDWGTVSQDQYRDRSAQAKSVMVKFRDLPINTIFVAQEKDHNRQGDDRKKLLNGLQTESFFAADLGSGTVKWMHDACDFVCQLYLAAETTEVRSKSEVAGEVTEDVRLVETGRSVRRLRCLLDQHHAAGFRSCDPDVVPQHIEAHRPEEMYADVMRVIRGERALKGYYPRS